MSEQTGCTSDMYVSSKYYMLLLGIMIILFLFLSEYFVRFLAVDSQYIYCAKKTVEERVFTCYRSLYSCGCEREGATPLIEYFGTNYFKS